MKKEVICVFIVTILLVPFSFAQLNYIEIKDVNVNDNAIQILIENKLDKNFNKITFIINEQYEIIKEEELKALESKYFVVNYPYGIDLVSLQVIINDQTASYVFTGNEDTFVINQETVLSTTTAESNSPISYIYSGQRLAKIQDGNVIYFGSDNIGSTSLQTDSSGSVNFKANYLPFGKELSFSSINEERYGFTSKEYDYESSLNYFNARYYNPGNGKFISNDPIFKTSEGGYQYVRNNPLTITDPSGKNSKEANFNLYGVSRKDERKISQMIKDIINSDPKLGSASCSTFTCGYQNSPIPSDSARYVLGETFNRNEFVIYPRRLRQNLDGKYKPGKTGLEIATVAEELHHMVYFNERNEFIEFIGNYIESSNIDVHGEDSKIQDILYGVMLDLPIIAEEIRAKDLTKQTLLKLYRNGKIDLKSLQQQDVEIESEIYSSYARVQNNINDLSGIMSEKDFKKVSGDLERFVKTYSMGRFEDLKLSNKK